MKFRYEISGTAADEQTWTAVGEVHIEKAGDFPKVFEQAMWDAFNQLTQGKAVFGKPGVGCNGPYKIMFMQLQHEDMVLDIPKFIRPH